MTLLHCKSIFFVKSVDKKDFLKIINLEVFLNNKFRSREEHAWFFGLNDEVLSNSLKN